MTVRRTGTARHRITSVHAGQTTVYLVDLTPGWTIRYTPGGAAGPVVYVQYADTTQARYDDNTALEYAA